jgi:hypothetical protein
MFAQALVESGALNSIALRLMQATSSLQGWLSDRSQTEWWGAAGAALLVLLAWGRKRSLE